MKVVVEIDLTKDQTLMSLCESDPKIVAMLKTYNSMDEGEKSETYLEHIGLYLWKQANFIETLYEICEAGSDRFYGQIKAFLFAFEIDDASACMFRLACHAPAAVSIRKL